MSKSNYIFSGATIKGLREYNQDSYFIKKNKSNQIICVVCDGIGSEEHSEIASRTLTYTFEKEFSKKTKIKNFYKFYNSCIKKSVRTINKIVNNNQKVGSTICCLLLTGDKAEMANLGDSRIYYHDSSKNLWSQKSYDHNLRNYIIAKFNAQKQQRPEWSTIIEEEKKKTLEKNESTLLALTNSIENGNRYKPTDSYYKVVDNVLKGDLFVVVTDGVYNWVKNNVYLEKQEAGEILSIALANGSNDNVTCVVIKNV